MKIECLVERLKEAVQQVERITGKNLTLPVLNSILIIASGKTLKFRATNLDLGIEIEIPARIEKEGLVLVPGGILNMVVSTLYDSKNITLEKVNQNLHLTTTKNNITIKTYPEDDFPTIPVIKGETFVFDMEKIIGALKSVSYSASFSDIKPEISSVYVYEHNNDLVFVATDSFRLAEKRIKIKKPQALTGVLVPIKNVVEIIRVFNGLEGEAIISVSKNQISFSYQNIYLTSRLIDGVFPDYNQIIPKEHKTEAVILRQDILGALKTGAVFSGKFNEVGIMISPKQKTFEVRTKHQETGESTTKINGAVSGEEIEVNFNHKYIFDSFQSIADDSVIFSFSGAGRPLTIRGAGDKSFLYLVMPMNR
ncbi:MAG: DNA polymerase III subunit beta [Patescibacteria group bacterium]